VSRWAQIHTRLARASHSQSGGLFFALIQEEGLCSLILTPSPKKPFAWPPADSDAAVWSTQPLLMQPGAWRATANDSIATRLQRRPFGDGLSAKSFHRAPSLPYFPCSPSVTRSVLVPRHITPYRGPRFCGLRASAFSGLLTPTRYVGSPSRKCSSCLGSGAHSRRFAQECPEGNPGKSKQEKFQWHSIPTPSL
jgi:hypothetical protein